MVVVVQLANINAKNGIHFLFTDTNYYSRSSAGTPDQNTAPISFDGSRPCAWFPLCKQEEGSKIRPSILAFRLNKPHKASHEREDVPNCLGKCFANICIVDEQREIFPSLDRDESSGQ